MRAAAAVALSFLACTGTIETHFIPPDAPLGGGIDGGGAVIDSPRLVDDAGQIIIVDAPGVVNDAGQIIFIDARPPPDAPPGTPDARPTPDAPPGTPDARPPPPPPPPVFPVHVEGRHLVDASGNPFLVQGDSAWSTIVQLNDADLEQYLADRQAKGFNTLLVNLLEHHFSNNPPNNVFGTGPFRTPGDFSTPNDAYFDRVDVVLERARAHGFLVLLAFAYLGFNGGNEGWYQELAAQGETKLRNYGAFLGQRYRNQTNIVWVAGGDYNPPNRNIVTWMVAGIQGQDPGHLMTVHCAPEFGALQYWAGEPWVNLDNVYTYGDVAAASAAAYQRSTLPFFLIESTYENEHGVTPRTLRGQAYGALLAGAAGQIFGNGPIWCFGPASCFNWTGPLAWKPQLNSRGSRDMATLKALFNTLPWSTFVPTPGLVTTNGSGTVASLAANRTVGTIYIPSNRTLSVDLSRMSGTTRGIWFDPVSGTTSAAGTWPNSGTQSVTTPGTNGGGDGDWVLVLDAR